MRNYKLILTNKAASVLSEIKSRHEVLYERIAHVLNELEQNPFQGKMLKGSLKGFYSYRIGDYRIIYRVVRNQLVVVVIDIGHRRDIYL